MNAFIACPAMTSRCRFQMAEYVPQARFIRKRWPPMGRASEGGDVGDRDVPQRKRREDGADAIKLRQFRADGYFAPTVGSRRAA
jgi:hypothetical protein